MTWGVFVYRDSFGEHYSCVIADDRLYDKLKDGTILMYGDNSFIWGRKGIENKEIDRICHRVNDLKSRLDNGESFDFVR